MTKGRQKNTYKIWILQITFQTTCLNGVANCKELSRNTDLVSRLCKQSRASDTFPAPPSVTHLSGSPQPICCWKVRWGPSLLLTHNFVQLALRQGPNIMATSSWHQYRRLDLFVIWLFTKLYRFVQLCHSLTTLSNALYDIPADKFRISWRHPRGNNTGALSVIHQINSKISSLWWHACFHLVLFLGAIHFSILRSQVHT